MFLDIQVGPEQDEKPLTSGMSNQLYESNGEPHLYHCTATFNKTRNRAMIIRPSGFETPGKLSREFTAFKEFFHKKTGILWRERMTSAEGSSHDKDKGEKKHKFEYIPPVRTLSFVTEHRDSLGKQNVFLSCGYRYKS